MSEQVHIGDLVRGYPVVTVVGEPLVEQQGIAVRFITPYEVQIVHADGAPYRKHAFGGPHALRGQIVDDTWVYLAMCVLDTRELTIVRQGIRSSTEGQRDLGAALKREIS